MYCSDEFTDSLVELCFNALPGVEGEYLAAFVNAILSLVAEEIMRERMGAAHVAGMLLDEEREKWLAKARGASAS